MAELSWLKLWKRSFEANEENENNTWLMKITASCMQNATLSANKRQLSAAHKYQKFGRSVFKIVLQLLVYL
jgi:hypothetical protein